MPTSITATSTGASAKTANAIAVSTSKNDSAAGWRSSTSGRTAASRRRPPRTARRSGSPSTLIRSRIETRCGLVNSPVRSPRARSRVSIIRAVEVLPLVPVMWMTG